jgi:predicted transposase/invertase (TIGR01784 family)
METIHAYSDIVVKYLLGREETKEELKAFINAVLTDSGFDEITTIEIRNPFTIKEFAEDKNSILDIKVTDANNRLYNIEIQTIGNSLFINRTLYYWAKLYSSQIQESNPYDSLYPVICINLINFNLFNNDRFHNCFYITEKDDPTLILADHLMIHFLEMPKLLDKTPATFLEKILLDSCNYRISLELRKIRKDPELERKTNKIL